MAKTTISIPDDLKARMSKEKGSVNWSAVAAGAFEQKLGELASQKQEKDMSDVVNRLRASKLTKENESGQFGHEIGYAWAKDNAEYDELERAVQLAEDPDIDTLLYYDESSGFSPGERVAFCILKEDTTNRNDAASFWEEIVEPQTDITVLNDESFLRGFLSGASDLYEQVSEQI